MILEVGDIIEIRNKQATICYTTTIDKTNYICVSFENKELEYNIYKYKFEDTKLLVAEVTDQEEIKPVLETFIKEGLKEYGLPKELEVIYSKIENKE